MNESVHCTSFGNYDDVCKYSVSVPDLDAKPDFREGISACNRDANVTPKLMVCHDMKGNYLNDRWNNGSNFENAFQLLHWSYIDVFCYFSHEFITIPPKAWVEACHRNDTPILGTIITEWEDGYNTCNDIFSSTESTIAFAEKVVALTKLHCLDGWLVNIENCLSVPAGHVENMIVFLKFLTTAVHQVNPSSTVIWYDAVTVEGTLQWQDTLNELNKPFYDACDGMFVNYTWKECSTRIEKEMVETTAADGDSVLKSRGSVYFGCDVFGRNTFGGGQWNCSKAYNHLCTATSNNTLDPCEDSGVYSMALFAPGWLMEEFDLCGRLGERGGDYTAAAEKFLTTQDRIIQLTCKFWRGLLEGAPNVIQPDKLESPRRFRVVRGPLRLSFDMAAGIHVFIAGRPFLHWNAWMLDREAGGGAGHGLFEVEDDHLGVQHPVPFYDLTMLRSMCWDPNIVLPVEESVSNEFMSPSLAFYPCAAFTGNTSLLVECAVPAGHAPVPIGGWLRWKTADILSANQLFSPGQEACIATVTLAMLEGATTASVDQVEVGVELQYFCLAGGETRTVLLWCQTDNAITNNCSSEGRTASSVVSKQGVFLNLGVVNTAAEQQPEARGVAQALTWQTFTIPFRAPHSTPECSCADVALISAKVVLSASTSVSEYSPVCRCVLDSIGIRAAEADDYSTSESILTRCAPRLEIVAPELTTLLHLHDMRGCTICGDDPFKLLHFRIVQHFTPGSLAQDTMINLYLCRVGAEVPVTLTNADDSGRTCETALTLNGLNPLQCGTFIAHEHGSEGNQLPVNWALVGLEEPFCAEDLGLITAIIGADRAVYPVKTVILLNSTTPQLSMTDGLNMQVNIPVTASHGSTPDQLCNSVVYLLMQSFPRSGSPLKKADLHVVRLSLCSAEWRI